MLAPLIALRYPAPCAAWRAFLTLFDLFMVVAMLLSILFGAMRGLLREAVTLAALFAGLVVMGVLGRPVGAVVGDGLVAVTLVLVLLFAAGFLAVHVALELIARQLIGPAPHRLDRWAGGLFGALRGWFLVGLALLVLTYYHGAGNLPPRVQDAWLRGFAGVSARILDEFGIDGRERAEPPTGPGEESL